MVSQIRDVLERYRDAGGRVEIEMFEGSGHFPAIDAPERFAEVFFGFVASAEG
jgi:pimeloyl-ACP methyl ester carboxylesterase